MKNLTTKKLSGFITTMMLTFSFTLVNAQGNGNDNGNNGGGNDLLKCTGNKVLCSTKSGGMICIKPQDCYRMTDEETSSVSLSLSAYPNPTSGTTTIYFSLPQSQDVSFRIFDVDGRAITTIADQKFEVGDNEIEWNASGIPAGVYVLQLRSGKSLATEKLIVTN